MWTRHLKKYQIVTAHVFIFCVKNLRQAFSKKSVSQIRKNPRVNYGEIYSFPLRVVDPNTLNLDPDPDPGLNYKY